MTLDFLDDTQVDYEEGECRVIECQLNNNDPVLALVQTGFGKFHFQMLAVCGLIYLNTALGITIVSFVLPAATCDFQ